MNEFDIKDIIDIEKQKFDFEYEPSTENKLGFNILNGFRNDQNKQVSEKEQTNKELISKLENQIG